MIFYVKFLKLYAMLIDAHCHLDHLSIENASAFLEQLSNHSISYVVASAAKSHDWHFYRALSEKYSNIKVCYGIHPLEISDHWQEELNTLETYVTRGVAIGEIGLDFHSIFQSENVERMKLQMKIFERQIRLAQKYHLPIVIHCRDAFTILKEILIYTKFDLHRAMFHCFVEDVKSVDWILENGGFVSYSGILTFKKPGHTVETAQRVPLNQILIETDSPYLSPVPYRGKVNSPENVRWIAQKLAEIKNISYDECVRVTSENTRKFFNF